MKKCCYCNATPVEWHHALQYHKQINEVYAIKPLCLDCHRGQFGTIKQAAKLKCEWLAITEGIEHLEKNYPKTNWKQRLTYLNGIYANKN